MQPTVVVLKGITTCCSEPLKCRSVPKKSLKFWSTSSRISGLLKPQLCLQTIKLHIVIYFVFLKSYLSVSKFVFSTLVQAEGFLLPPKVIVILYILPGFRVFFAACGGNLRCRPEASLRSRRFEVMGAGKNGGARGRQARGEGAPAREVHENHFQPPILTTWPVLRDLSKVLKENDWPRTDKPC